MSNENILLNKYKLIEPIGEGSYSKVYKALHIEKKYYVAIKFDHDEISKKLIKNEIKIYLLLIKSKIQNIANIKTYSSYNDYNYIIMELLPNTLNNYIQKNYKYFTEQKSKKNIYILFMHFYQLIDKLHNINIIHRDIKPDNFLLDKNDNLYIIDLGLSTYYNEKYIQHNVIGSYLFSSYNVHKESYCYTKNDDIISIFYMLFYSLTNKLPWENIYIENIKNKNVVFYFLKEKTNYLQYYKNEGYLHPLIQTYYYFIEHNELKLF